MKKMIVSVASVLVAGTILAGIMLTSASESKGSKNTGDEISTVLPTNSAQVTSESEKGNPSDVNVFPSEPNKSDSTASTTSESVSNDTISLAQAKEKALKDAGVSSSDVKFTKAKLDKKDGKYEVEFIATKSDGQYEYEYEINAKTGKITEKELKSVAVTSVPYSEKKVISLETAKGVALKDAGLTVNDCTFTKAKLDKDDGEYEYELEFNDGKKKYSYSVDAYTSEITERETENIKKPTSDKTSSQTTATTKITLDEAKKIALSDAKVKNSDVTFTKTEYDRDDFEYEIEFTCNGKEYEYEIGRNGTINKKDVEKIKDSDYHTSALISIDKARSIALTHAGLKENEIKQKKIELERDDGIYKYEFEFVNGIYEYEYEINAKTGEIIDFEKEIDD